tara:strand:- start:332 stop:946 length:615 start_codon:yes stop_codon:yes gene_type:complete
MKKTEIRKNSTFSIFKFSLQCIKPGTIQKYVTKTKKWIGMNGDLLNDANIRRCPYINIEVCLKQDFNEWWKTLITYHPPFASQDFVQLNIVQLNTFTTAMNEAIMIEEDETETLDVGPEGSATHCDLSLYDEEVGSLCIKQAIDIVIPRFEKSITKPKLRSYIKFCKCGSCVFIDDLGIVREWDNPSVEHCECMDAFFYRLPRK